MNWEQAVLWLRDQPGQAELVKACFYDDPLIDAARRFHDSREWSAVRKLLPRERGRALDVGAGRGIASHALARDGWEVVAIEPDPSVVVGAGAIRRLAREANLNLEVHETTGEHLPFADASFDLVYCRQSLHHAHDLQMLCRELGRVLRSGGVFLATREHVISRKADLPRFFAKHPLHHLYHGEQAYLLEEYAAAIESGGIRVCRVMNPLQSRINHNPGTVSGIVRSAAGQISRRLSGLVPDRVLGLLGRFDNRPGRLYSFLGKKLQS